MRNLVGNGVRVSSLSGSDAVAGARPRAAPASKSVSCIHTAVRTRAQEQSFAG